MLANRHTDAKASVWTKGGGRGECGRMWIKGAGGGECVRSLVRFRAAIYRYGSYRWLVGKIDFSLQTSCPPLSFLLARLARLGPAATIYLFNLR